MNGKLCMNCSNRSNVAGNGPEFQYCEHPKAMKKNSGDRVYIWFMHEDDCPKRGAP